MSRSRREKKKLRRQQEPRYNATKHGCCSNRTILPDESEEEYNALVQSWIDGYKPEHLHERTLVARAAHAEWILKRNTKRFDDCEYRLREVDASQWTAEDQADYERFTRYKTTAERSFQRARANVEQMRRVREEQRRYDAKLAIMEREEALKEEQQQREIAERKAEEQKRKPVQRDPDEPKDLAQYVSVFQRDGKTVTELKPSNAELIQQLEEMKPPKSKNIWRIITCKPDVPNEYVWMIWNLPGPCRSHKYQQMSIEEWFYIMDLEKDDPDGNLYPIDKDDPRWSGDFGAWRAEQEKKLESDRQQASGEELEELVPGGLERD